MPDQPDQPDQQLVVATLNANGVRAAVRRGLGAWLERRRPDVLCLQEVRAPDAVLRELLEAHLGGGWHVAHAEPADAGDRGRAGVALASRHPLDEVVVDLPGRFAGAGRWVQARVAAPRGPLVVASVYVHTGEAGTARQEEKEAFLAAVERRMAELGAGPGGGGAEALVCGDTNVAPAQEDLRNWRGNLAKAGFLPSERDALARWAGAGGGPGWVDVVRAAHPGVEGPYSWWSWRGQAFDRDTGWRIDQQWASPALAARARAAGVDRAASYAERTSDHAPVWVRYA